MKREETTKKNQGERAYVVSLLRNAIDICNVNITNTIQGKMLLKQEYFGEIYNELIKISKSENWFLEVKSQEFDSLNEDNLIYDMFVNSSKGKMRISEYYNLNHIERSLIFLELDTLAARAANFNVIQTVHWKGMRNGLMILLFNIIKGVANKETTRVLLKIREDGIIIDCVFSYGRPLSVKDEFNPEKVCEEMFFYKRWRGELYSIENKLIKVTPDYTHLCDDFNLNLKIDGVKEKSSVNGDENYVDILDTGIALKRAGKFEEAKEAFIKAIRIDNTMPTAYYNLGKILYILDEHDASVRSYVAAYERGICDFIKNTPFGVYNLHLNLGHSLLDNIYLVDSKYMEVIETYRSGIKGMVKRDAKVSNLQDEYEHLCAKEAEDFLKGLN